MCIINDGRPVSNKQLINMALIKFDSHMKIDLK